MRKLPLSLLLVLLAFLACSAPAQALSLPDVLGPESSEEDADEAEADDEDEAEAESDSEECEIEDEEDVALCAEIAEEDRGEAEAERCILEDATAKLAARPGNHTVQLIIRYQAAAPASVAIDARLRGSHGGLHLGSEHTHFRRSGVYRSDFALSENQMQRALGAREFAVRIQAVNTPRLCRISLEGAPRRAKRSLHAGAPGRSGGRGRTRGR